MADIVYLEQIFREEEKTNYAAHTTSNAYVIEWRAKDPAVTFKWRWVIVTAAATTADFAALANGDLLFDLAGFVTYMKDATGDNFATFTTTT